MSVDFEPKFLSVSQIIYWQCYFELLIGYEN
jgi:hypothetical protein